MDFGLAKLLHDPRIAVSLGSSAPTASAAHTLSQSGTPGGTAAYMSPEQARGEQLDNRSDLFSLGAVLYEMVTGQRAFKGTTPALIFDGILNRVPESPSRLNPGIPAALERVIDKAMEKDRALRYQHAADLVADLRRVKRAMESGTLALLAAPRLPARRAVLVVSLFAAVALAAGGYFWTTRQTNAAAPLTEKDSIILGEFANRTGDTVFDGTLRQALAVQLGQSPFLDILPDERIVEALRLGNHPRDERLTRPVALEVCERLGAAAVIDGSVTPLGQLYVLTLTAVECGKGNVLVQEQANAESREKVLQALGHLTSSIRPRLGESLATLEKFDLPVEQVTTPSLDALRAYTLGLGRRAAGNDVESIPFFERAIQLDPDFAMAHTALSTVYSNIGESQRSEEYIRRAYESRSRVTERERLFITFQYRRPHYRGRAPRDRDAGGLEALVSPRLSRAERAVPAVQPHGSVSTRGRRGHRGDAPQPGAPVSVLESGLRLSRHEPLRRCDADRERGGGAQVRDAADATFALSARHDRGPRCGGGDTPRMGAGQSARVRPDRRRGAGGGVSRQDGVGARALHADDRDGREGRLQRSRVGVRGAIRVDRSALRERRRGAERSSIRTCAHRSRRYHALERRRFWRWPASRTRQKPSSGRSRRRARRRR